MIVSSSGYIEEWRSEYQRGVFCLGVDSILVSLVYLSSYKYASGAPLILFQWLKRGLGIVLNN